MTNHSESGSQNLGDARLLDSGAEAEIYEWGTGRVLRLLRAEPGNDGRALDDEAQAMRDAAAAGVPVPAVHELVIVDGRRGMVIDRIDGVPMLDAMLSHPWRIFAMAREFGEIHAALHGADAPDSISSVHETTERRLTGLDPTDAWLQPWAKIELNELALGTALLHGDFHPGNVLVDSAGPWVIDWPGAVSGPPEADVARTIVLVESAVPPNANWLSRTLIGLVRTRIFMPRYLAGYRKRRDLDMGLVRRWRMLKTIERLAEAPESERPTLRRMIRDSGGPPDFGNG